MAKLKTKIKLEWDKSIKRKQHINNQENTTVVYANLAQQSKRTILAINLKKEFNECEFLRLL